MDTKAVNLTTDELQSVIQYRARIIAQSGPGPYNDEVERLRYLNKRLNDFTNGDSEPRSQEAPVKEASTW